MSPVNRDIRLHLARKAAALHLDIGTRLAEGLSPDDRTLAPTLTEAVVQLKAIEEVAESQTDDALLLILVAETAELLPITKAAVDYAEAAQTVLLAVQEDMSEGGGKKT